MAEPLAQPIAGASGVAPANVLRWQTKRGSLPDPVGQTFLSATNTSPAAQPPEITASAPIRTGWNITRIDPNVRPAQALSPDPFQDPFDDSKSARQPRPLAPRSGTSAAPAVMERGPTLTLQPAAAGTPVETLPAPRVMSGPQPRGSSQQSAGQSLHQVPAEGHSSPPLAPTAQEEIPANPLLTATQPSGNLPPTGIGDLEEKTTAPCDRVYNDHNCCELETKCNELRQFFRSSSLAKISLDITPRYSPGLNKDEADTDRQDKLRLLESRSWRNRRGEVVATGKMTNIENGSVIVADEAGRQLGRVSLFELNEEDLCYVNAWWELPAECALRGLPGGQRNWIPSTYAWHASALCHKPLYFEDVQLERYGHTHGPYTQPLICGAHFFKCFFALPYQMGMHPEHECQYSLGYYRPGSCAPWMIEPIPLSLRGALFQTGAVLGAVHLIP